MRRQKMSIRAGLFVLAVLFGCRDPLPTPPGATLENIDAAPAAIVGPPGMGFNVVGVNSSELTPANIQQAVGYAQTAGVTWVRLQVWWPDIHSDRGVWREEERVRHHTVIDAFNNAGMQVMVTLKGTPTWACYGLDVSPCASDPTYVPDDLPAWGEFVSMMMAEYPTVNHWGIWNEPTDQNQFKSDRLSREDAYRELILYAWAAKNQFSGKKLLAPEDGNLVFLDSILRTHAWAIDVITTHGYGYSWGVQNQIRQTDAKGRAYKPPHGMPIWLTETGDPVNPVPGNPEVQPTDAQQAAHITNVLQIMNAQTIVNWQKTFPWHLFNPWHSWDLPGFRYVHDAFTANPSFRPAYWCYREVALGLPASRSCTDATECYKLPESPSNDPSAECLVARFEGPVRVRPGYSCVWKAIAAGTTALQYTWKVNGVQQQVTSSSFSHYAYSSFILQAKVRDGFGHEKLYSWHVNVTTSSPGCG